MSDPFISDSDLKRAQPRPRVAASPGDSASQEHKSEDPQPKSQRQARAESHNGAGIDPALRPDLHSDLRQGGQGDQGGHEDQGAASSVAGANLVETNSKTEDEDSLERGGQKARRKSRLAFLPPLASWPSYIWQRSKKFSKLLYRLFTLYRSSSLTRRIIVLNMIGLAVLVTGIIFQNQSRAGLIDAKVRSLETQGRIIAAAISASATVETNDIIIDPERLLELQSGQNIKQNEDELGALEFPINPERVAPVLRHLIEPTGTRARIYARNGGLILDSTRLYGRSQGLFVSLPATKKNEETIFTRLWLQATRYIWYGNLPEYQEIGEANGKAYSEVETALGGVTTPIVRINKNNHVIVSVAVPIQRLRSVLGVLLLSTQSGEIDEILTAEHNTLARLTTIAFIVTLLVSLLLAGTIADPLSRLSAAAVRVRKSIKAREEIPDYSKRNDEIGDLSIAFRDMTATLYRRLDAIESFAADVSHELKNPLTSMRSAAETLPLAKRDEDRERLIEIIQTDVKRLDRLISDISNASRLDAELARADADPVDIVRLISSVTHVFNDLHDGERKPIAVQIEPARGGNAAYIVNGHDSRLGQVITNLLDNAISFTPLEGRVGIKLRRVEEDDEIEIMVEDEGRGINPDNFEKVFERFYTDRPDAGEFGKNSGLGLNISRQIILAHEGRIWAENKVPGVWSLSDQDQHAEQNLDDQGQSGASAQALQEKSGARFVIRLPAADAGD